MLPRRMAGTESIVGLKHQRHFIDGIFVDAVAGGSFETLDPTTNEVLTTAASGDAADVDRAVAAAATAFREGPWPRMKAKEKAKVMRGIADLIRANADDLIRLECLDIGMPIHQMKGLAARAAENF